MAKSNNSIKFLLLSFIILSPVIGLAGGGWTKKKGEAYYKVSQWWVVASKHYTGNGGTDPNATTGIYNTSLYAEYGINDRITGILYFPFFSRNTRNAQVSAATGMVTTPGQSLNSIGDADIGIKYGLTKPGSKFVVAATLQLGVPSGNDSGGTDGSLQTGDGEFNQMVRVDVSRSFSIKSVNGYANVYAGFNNRTKNFSDEFRAGGELGASFIKNKLWAIVRLDLIESLKNGLSSADGSDGTTIFANNTEFFAYTYELAYYITDKIGVSASTGRVFNASLILAAPSYSVGVFLDLK